jgi:hypothetical protein
MEYELRVSFTFGQKYDTMATKDPSKARQEIWLVVFIVTPFSLLRPMAEKFTDDNGTEMLVGGALGLLGVAIGFCLYALFGKRSIPVRIGVLVMVLLAGIALARWA